MEAKFYTPVDSKLTADDVRERLRGSFAALCSQLRQDLQVLATDEALLLLLVNAYASEIGKLREGEARRS